MLRALAAGNHSTLATGHAHQAGVVDRVRVSPAERVSGQPEVCWRGEDRRATVPDRLRHRTFVNLGSWTFSETTYGIYRAGHLTLRDWRSGRVITDRAYQMAFSAEQIPGMREWWKRYYRGFLRYDTQRVRQDRAHIDAAAEDER